MVSISITAQHTEAQHNAACQVCCLLLTELCWGWDCYCIVCAYPSVPSQEIAANIEREQARVSHLTASLFGDPSVSPQDSVVCKCVA
jgi:hypothetical protein